jgi:predicted MFS family arabinose efflux permease
MSDHTLPVPASAPHPPSADPRRWWVLVWLSLAQLMVILDITVVNVALPSIGTDLQLDRTSLTWVVTAYTLCFGGLLLGTFFLASLYLQRLHGSTALATGLVFLPAALATIAASNLAARAVSHLGARPVAAAGFSLATAGTLLLSRLPADASILVDLLPGLLLATAGLGAGLVVATTTAMAHVDQAQAGVTSGLLNTGHELGASLGVAVVSTIAAASITSDPVAGRPPVGGFDRAFLACAVVAAAAAVATGWLLPPGRPSATNRPRFTH